MKFLLLTSSLFLAGWIHAQSLLATSQFFVINNHDKLSVIDIQTNTTVYTSEVNSRDAMAGLFISSDSSKIWYAKDFDYYCLDTKTWKAEKKLSGKNVFTFNPSSDNHFVVFTESMGDEFTSSIYNANDASLYKTVSYKANAFLNDVAYDEKTGYLYQSSRNYSAGNEPIGDFYYPETVGDVETALKNDGNESELVVIDVSNGQVLYQKSLFYSPQSASEFMFIQGQLHLVTKLGTARIEKDFSLHLLPLVLSGTPVSFGTIGANLVGFSTFEVFRMNCSTMHVELPETIHDDILMAEAGCISSTGLFCVLKPYEILMFSTSDFANPIRVFEIPE